MLIVLTLALQAQKPIKNQKHAPIVLAHHHSKSEWLAESNINSILQPTISLSLEMTSPPSLLKRKLQPNSLKPMSITSKRTIPSTKVSELRKKITESITKHHTFLSLQLRNPPGSLLLPFSALLVSLEPAMLP